MSLEEDLRLVGMILIRLVLLISLVVGLMSVGFYFLTLRILRTRLLILRTSLSFIKMLLLAFLSRPTSTASVVTMPTLICLTEELQAI